MLCTDGPSEFRDSLSVGLVNDGLRPFVAERPDVSRTDGALLFLHKTMSQPARDDLPKPTQSKNPPKLRRSPRRVKVVPPNDLEELTIRDPVHLEDVIACLQFKVKDQVINLFIVYE
jgi:hypothetical protein